jgi:hypothetical protein
MLIATAAALILVACYLIVRRHQRTAKWRALEELRDAECRANDAEHNKRKANI